MCGTVTVTRMHRMFNQVCETVSGPTGADSLVTRIYQMFTHVCVTVSGPTCVEQLQRSDVHPHMCHSFRAYMCGTL